MTNNTSNPRRLQPMVAMRALKKLIADPEKTDQVFVIINAMSGDSLERTFARFRETETGLKIMAERRQLLTVLENRDDLRSHGPDSFAASYLKFVEAGQLTANGLVEASDTEELIQDSDLRFFGERMRDQHDLWHTVTGYGMDPFGEACLLAFTYAQTKNRGLGIIALVGMIKIAQDLGTGVIKAMWQAYRAGKKAAWLPQQDWEALLAKPIGEVRQQLHIGSPQTYQEVLAYRLASA